MTDLSKLIVNTACSYIGQREKMGNSGFYDEVFEKKLKLVGFDEKEAWCSLFAELVWKESYAQYNSFFVQLLDVIFNEGAVKTYLNFRKSKDFNSLCVKTPMPGALIFWQKYKNGEAQWQGHVGVFIEFINGKMITVEGNTNEMGGREGDGVYKKSREINYSNLNGLRLLGFVNPKI